VKANPSFAESRLAIILACAGVALGGLAAYHNSFAGSFISDDRLSILDNPTIRRLGSAFFPPKGWTTVSGRPALNFSFALNYAVSGLNFWSYHALNLLIHILAGLTLFGVVRRTLELTGPNAEPVWSNPPPARPRSSATSLAFAVALLWTVHPLQTESVTYVVQRAESLMGLFYLLTLYFFVRAAGGDEANPPFGGGLSNTKGSPESEVGGDGRPARPSYAGVTCRCWLGLSFLACLLGMLTKEVMVTAPLIVLLYDRSFIRGSFSGALRSRPRFYAALAATWLPLGFLVASGGGNRGGSIGIGASADAREYLLTQFPAIVRYLQLSVWPRPLVFDHGLQYIGDARAIAISAAVLIGLIAATIFALRRRPSLGFLGASFFLILAPSSLMPGTRQSLAEHRMYLPLAAVIALGVLAAEEGRNRWLQRLDRRAGMAFCAVLALAFCALTVRRNAVYRSPMAIWSDTAAKQPKNGYAQSVVGALLVEGHRTGEGIARYETAVRLLPAVAELRYDLANALVESGRVDEALDQYAQSARLKPDFAEAQCNWGLALAKNGRISEAVGHFAEAARLNPGNPDLPYFLGVALARCGRLAEARDAFEQALKLRPDSDEFRYKLNLVLRAMKSAP
jgi:cytochrome c-type biogenesis protein CcmH/NrfG